MLPINVHTELPFNEVNAVMSRLPLGVVNLLRGRAVPQGPSLRQAYLPLNVLAVLTVIRMAVLAWWSTRTRRAAWSVLMLLMAIATLAALPAMGLSPTMLAAFAPDLALLLAVWAVLLCLPAAWRAEVWVRRSSVRGSAAKQP